MTRAKTIRVGTSVAQRSSVGREVAAALEHTLAQHGTPTRAAGAKKYLKSDLAFLGVEVPVIRKTARAFCLESKGMPRTGVLAVCSALWKRPIYECRALAVAILERNVKLLDARDLDLLERMTRQSNTWSLSDWIAIFLVGPILAQEPDGKRLDRWAKDDDFWVRRLALIAQLKQFAKGAGDWPRWVKHAESMLVERGGASKEERFFIRKATGWVLRSRGDACPDDVVEFVRRNRTKLSGLTLREATRNLAAPDQRRALSED